MIECKKCGAQLDIHTEKCPYCGTVNEEAIEHIRKMEHYEKEFDVTRKEVVSKVKTFSRGYGRLVTLIVLLIASFLGLFLLSQSYEITEAMERTKQGKTIEEIHAKMDQYLAQEDYDRFETYVDYLNGAVYMDEFREERRLSYVVEHIIKVKKAIFEDRYGVHNDYNDPLSKAAESIYDFYQERIDEENSILVKGYETLEKELQSFLKTFAHLTKEDLDGLKGSTISEITHLLHERMKSE